MVNTIQLDWEAVLIKSTLNIKDKLLNNQENMKSIVAIPLENGHLCSHFGHCQQFALIDVENNTIIGEKLVTPPPHEPGLLPGWLAERGVTDVIAGGMGQRALDLFSARHIKVSVGAEPKSPKDLVNDWLKNTLVTGSNACDH
jgi:predicted Fe-Mo cluster-binding NifX family protein